MNPEDTKPTQPTPDEPLAPPAPEPSPFAPSEPLDDGGFTPPHGDPLGEAALEHPAAAPQPSETTPEVDTFAPLELRVVSERLSEQPHYFGPVEPAPAGLYLPENPDEAPRSQPHAESAGYAAVAPTQDDLEAAALVTPAVASEGEAAGEPEALPEGGPNWMLAFICAWSSAISLREAWATLGGAGFGMILRNLGVLGYLLLGIGLLAYAVDALRWGRPRRSLEQLLIPTAFTLAGVVCLVLWNDRGRPI